MVSELLKKEKEYYQLNEDIEKKTQNIIQEVNYVMNTADTDFSTRISHFDFNSDYHQNPPRKSLNFDDFDCADLNIPECTKEMGVKGFSHYLRATIKGQQGEIKALQNTNKTQQDELKKHQKENKKLGDENEKLHHIAIANKNHIVKMENQLTSLQSIVQVKENENVALKKENDKLQREIKSIGLKLMNAESKLGKFQEDSDKHKGTVNCLKQEIKDLKQDNKEKFEAYKMSMKKIETQKMDILGAFKKQMLLVDNFKKQNVHIKNLKITEKLETDFMKILNWKFD